MNLIELLNPVASLAPAVVGWLALQSWRKQDKAKRQAEFLDEVVEETHSYLAKISRPLALLRAARIGMMSHGSSADFKNDVISIDGAVGYIKRDGESMAKRLREALSDTEMNVTRLRSLATKGQIFGFKDYSRFLNSINLLTHQFDRIVAFSSMIEIPSMNWDNPAIITTLNKIIKITPEEIYKAHQENHVAILEFSKDNYGFIFG